MNAPHIRARVKELEKEFNILGFYKIHEDKDLTKAPGYPWSVLFVRYEAYCYDLDMTLEKLNKRYHSKLVKHKNGSYTFPKKDTETPYCFVYMDLNEITFYDILPESELGSLFSQLSSHKAAGIPTIHKFTPTELIELTKIVIEYQELMCEMAQ